MVSGFSTGTTLLHFFKKKYRKWYCNNFHMKNFFYVWIYYAFNFLSPHKKLFCTLKSPFCFYPSYDNEKKEKKTFFILMWKGKKKFLKGRREVKRIRTESEFSLAGNVCCLKDTKWDFCMSPQSSVMSSTKSFCLRDDFATI